MVFIAGGISGIVPPGGSNELRILQRTLVKTIQQAQAVGLQHYIFGMAQPVIGKPGRQMLGQIVPCKVGYRLNGQQMHAIFRF